MASILTSPKCIVQMHYIKIGFTVIDWAFRENINLVPPHCSNKILSTTQQINDKNLIIERL